MVDETMTDLVEAHRLLVMAEAMLKDCGREYVDAEAMASAALATVGAARAKLAWGLPNKGQP